MEENSVAMQQGFIYAHCKLDATTVDVIFSKVDWSTKESNRYRKEKTTITHWHDLLQDFEGLCMSHIPYAQNLLSY
jgi:hypothetical protein